MQSNFKDRHPIERRKKESERIRSKYPCMIPIIVDKEMNSNIPEIDKKKYLIPINFTMGQFNFVIRRRIKLPPEKALFLFIENVIPPTSMSMNEIDKQYCDEDGFIYIKYNCENTFG
jgi:GABA(A) receptor-associated protein